MSTALTIVAYDYNGRYSLELVGNALTITRYDPTPECERIDGVVYTGDARIHISNARDFLLRIQALENQQSRTFSTAPGQDETTPETTGTAP